MPQAERPGDLRSTGGRQASVPTAAEANLVTAGELKRKITVVMFDQYGTVVDMQGGLTEIGPRSSRPRAGPAIRAPSSLGGAARISRAR